MKVVRIMMLQNFADGDQHIILHKGKTYFAIDGGDYWLVQRYSDSGFIRAVPKGSQKPIEYAKVVPIHTHIVDTNFGDCGRIDPELGSGLDQ